MSEEEIAEKNRRREERQHKREQRRQLEAQRRLRMTNVDKEKRERQTLECSSFFSGSSFGAGSGSPFFAAYISCGRSTLGPPQAMVIIDRRLSKLEMSP